MKFQIFIICHQKIPNYLFYGKHNSTQQTMQPENSTKINLFIVFKTSHNFLLQAILQNFRTQRG